MSDFFLHAFQHGIREAERIAHHLGCSVAPILVRQFPDHESLVTVSKPTSCVCIYCPLDKPNERLINLLLAADALRRNGAKRIVLIAPYLCYMRQDKAFHAGEAVGQQAIGKFLASLFDRIVTVDPHLHRVKTMSEAFPGIDAESLSAAPAIADFIRVSCISSTVTIAGPDCESGQWVEQLGTLLGCRTLVGVKRRLGDHSVEIEFPSGALNGTAVLLVDDIVSSGGTVIEAIGVLKKAGAGEVFVTVTHALFDSETERRIREAGAKEIWSTDSVPHTTNAISLSFLLAETLKREIGVQL
ncbi:MAG: ribose-phosphate diphosphokinase [Parvibaculum sp.]|nr:ribose-phosphate diphosphokinase [Parvibaculum sp.]